MRHGFVKHTTLLALACAAGLAVYGCNRDYESKDNNATNDQYGDTGTGLEERRRLLAGSRCLL